MKKLFGAWWLVIAVIASGLSMLALPAAPAPTRSRSARSLAGSSTFARAEANLVPGVAYCAQADAPTGTVASKGGKPSKSATIRRFLV